MSPFVLRSLRNATTTLAGNLSAYPMMRSIAPLCQRPSGGILPLAAAAPAATRVSLFATMAQSSPSSSSPSRIAAPKGAAALMAARAMSSQAQQVADSWEVNLRHGPDYMVGPRPDDWWTGAHPTETPGFDATTKTLHALPHLNLATCTRKEIKDHFDNIWALTEVLFSGLKGEQAFYRPPYHHLRHPLIFYLGHTSALYINKMRVAGLVKDPINLYYEQIFETGVDEMKWDDMSKNAMVWPSVEEVLQYRREVYNTVVDVIENHPDFDTLATSSVQEHPFWSLALGYDHEKIHLETSSVLFRELPIDVVQKPAYWPELAEIRKGANSNPEAGKDYPINSMVAVPGGEVRLGKPRDFPSFGWDNEYGERVAHVKDFEASKYLISNGEFYDFVKSGCYSDETLWSSEGWAWRTFRNAKWPTFWVKTGPTGLHEYKLRTIFEEHDMQWDWPAEVNYHEAHAYTNWKTKQDEAHPAYHITTEYQHHRLRDETTRDQSLGVNRDYIMDPVRGSAAGLKDTVNVNLAYGSPTPVNALPPTSAGAHDVFGNVWEWCEDHLSALQNFSVHPYYEDFSIPCFDGEHNIILGGSFASCGDEASIFARFHFRPHFFQHSGFRLIRPNEAEPALETSCMDNEGPFVGQNPFRTRGNDAESLKYEAEETLQQYIHLHYDAGNGPDFLPESHRNWTGRAADLLVSQADKHNVSKGRVLDIGCSVGGMTFKLAKSFDEAVGLDISAAFIDTAKHIQQHQGMAYRIRQEGDIFEQCNVVIPDGVASNVTFRQADASCMPLDMGQFDAAVVTNVIDRLATPKAGVSRLGGQFGMVKPGGLLLVASPFSWRQSFTPKDLWLGGREIDGEPRYGKDGLAAVLQDNWTLLHETDMPLVLREHARKYELVVSYVSVWQHTPSA